MTDCYFLTYLPDIGRRPLLSCLKNYFGDCFIDLFYPKFGEKFNGSSCKVFLPRKQSNALNLFSMSPFCTSMIDFGFENLILCKRWVKNDFAMGANHCNYIDPCPENDFKSCENLKYNDCMLFDNKNDMKTDKHLQSPLDINPLCEENNLKMNLNTCSQGSIDILCPGRDSSNSDVVLNIVENENCMNIINEDMNLIEKYEIVKNDLRISAELMLSIIKFLWRKSNGQKKVPIGVDQWKSMIVKSCNMMNCKETFFGVVAPEVLEA